MATSSSTSAVKNNHMDSVSQSLGLLAQEMRINSAQAVIIPFDGTRSEQYQAWKQAILRYVPELSKSGVRSLILRTLSGPALSLFSRNISTPENTFDENKSVNDFFSMLDSAFCQKPAVSPAYQELVSIKKSSNEHALSYGERLRLLAKSAFSDDLTSPTRQSDLFQIFVRGLDNQTLQMKLMSMEDRTLDKAIHETVKFEADLKAIQAIQTNFENDNSMSAPFSQYQVASMSSNSDVKTIAKEIVSEVLPALMQAMNVQQRGRSQNRNFSRERYNYNRSDRYDTFDNNRSVSRNRDYDRRSSSRPNQNFSKSSYRERYDSRNRYSPQREQFRNSNRNKSRDCFDPNSFYNRRDSQRHNDDYRQQRSMSRSPSRSQVTFDRRSVSHRSPTPYRYEPQDGPEINLN